MSTTQNSQATEPTTAAAPESPPRTEFTVDEGAGVFLVRDPRVFGVAQRGFGRRLVESLVQETGVRQAIVDLEAATCRVEFQPSEPTSSAMSDAFARAVHAAFAVDGDGRGTSVREKDAAWLKLAAFPFGDRTQFWDVSRTASGRLRLRHRGGPTSPSPALRAKLAHFEGVQRCRFGRWMGGLTIDVPDDSTSLERLLAEIGRFQAPPNGPNAAGQCPADPVETPRPDGSLVRLSRSERAKYLCLAAGSLVLTGVAIAIPGVPTVPLLMATSYYAARASARLDAALRRAPFFGPIVCEIETFHALSRRSKVKLIGMTVAIVGISLASTSFSPTGVVVVAVLATVSVTGIALQPEIGDTTARRPAIALT